MVVKSLNVFVIPKERRTNHYMCRPYIFQVQSGCTNQTAFYTWHAFKNWLRDHNLKLGERARYRKIIGSYKEVYTPNLPKDGKHIMTLNNGRYVQAVIRIENGETIKYIYHTGIYDPKNDQSIADYRGYEALVNGRNIKVDI